jgi:hypothetical protein
VGKIRGESGDSLALCFIDREVVGLPQPLVLILSFVQCAELVVPLGFQSVRNQTVGRIHMHISTLGQICLVACALYLLAAQAVDLIQACVDFLLHRQRHIERHRCHDLNEQIADGVVDRLSLDALTTSGAVLDAVFLAYVVGDAPRVPAVVTNSHSITAHAA